MGVLLTDEQYTTQIDRVEDFVGKLDWAYLFLLRLDTISVRRHDPGSLFDFEE